MFKGSALAFIFYCKRLWDSFDDEQTKGRALVVPMRDFNLPSISSSNADNSSSNTSNNNNNNRPQTAHKEPSEKGNIKRSKGTTAATTTAETRKNFKMHDNRSVIA